MSEGSCRLILQFDLSAICDWNPNRAGARQTANVWVLNYPLEWEYGDKQYNHCRYYSMYCCVPFTPFTYMVVGTTWEHHTLMVPYCSGTCNYFCLLDNIVNIIFGRTFLRLSMVTICQLSCNLIKIYYFQTNNLSILINLINIDRCYYCFENNTF